MSRLSSAFSSFFSILFSGILPEEVAREFGYVKDVPPPPPPPPAPKVELSDGALQLLHILQRDARMIDFFMEDMTPYTDEQVGGAVRTLHKDCKATLDRHVVLAPVVDSVEGTFQKLDQTKAPDPNRFKLLGNIPASGKIPGGTLRHRGWIATSITLPILGKHDPKLIAPAEIEVE